MPLPSGHTFHIPVMGLAFTVDTPLKVARYGISSVISIVDDILIEGMREYYYGLIGEPYIPITNKETDFRARRITDYLNLVDRIVGRQWKEMQHSSFGEGSDIARYFELLPEVSPLKKQYRVMLATGNAQQREKLCSQLRSGMHPGAIDVNIMTKLDKHNFAEGKPLPPEFSDALAALRGFAKSTLSSSIVLSAGMNMRLYSYIEQFPDFYPDEQGNVRKKIILKVSDYRSAFIQGKMLAKKGLWVSEYRIESGLNCGGHAFATDGLLMGPILEEFKEKRVALREELAELYTKALAERGMPNVAIPPVYITVQGGIGTAQEHVFLLQHYGVDATGWGSPFLLVPEATNVDPETRQLLAESTSKEFYTSHVSPLGVLFNTVKGTSSEQQKERRIAAGRPGSPCVKKYLVSNTEFTEQPICTASRQYQELKIQQLKGMELAPEAFNREYRKVVEKDCLCEGLAASALINANSTKLRRRAVLVCPGPNLAYFSGTIRLDDMVGHIYGRRRLPFHEERPHMFINELRLYIEYLKNTGEQYVLAPTEKQKKYLASFAENMRQGILYYKRLADSKSKMCQFDALFQEHIAVAEQELEAAVVVGEEQQ